MVGLVVAPAGPAIGAEDAFDLSPDPATLNQPLRVEATLTIRGQAEGEIADAPPAPIAFDAELAYRQQPADPTATGATPRFVRRYDRVTAPTGWRADRRLVVAELGFGAPLVSTPAEAAGGAPLSRAELSLAELAADPLCIDGVLPTEPVRPGSTWRLTGEAARRLMRLDAVTHCEVTAIVSDATTSHARLRFAGPIEGSTRGAAVTLDLRGVALVRRDTSAVEAINLGWRETRTRGAATPALKATAKLNVRFQPTEECLDPEALAAAAYCELEPRLETPVGDRWLALVDRSWHVVQATRTATTLRRVAASEPATQLTLTPAGEAVPSLGEFERDVRFSLGDPELRVTAVESSRNEAGLERMTILSEGQLGGVPTAWRHDHVIGPTAALAATATYPLPTAEGEATAAKPGLDAAARVIASLQLNAATEGSPNARTASAPKAPAVR